MSQQQSGDLDTQRAQLLEAAERYLAALLAHDPQRAQLAAHYRGTENTTVVRPGEGLWQTANEFPAIQYFVDPLTAQVVAMGAVRAAGELSPFMLRLKLDCGAISESESIVSPNRHGYFCEVEQLLKPDVLYDAPVPHERAVDREQLQAAADSYWSALQASDGSLARFGYRCDNYDNGAKTTNTLRTLLSPDAAYHSCASALNATRAARPLARDRRFPTLDEERGVATSLVMVDFHPIPNNPRDDAGTFYMLGVFKIVDGEIRSLDEIRVILPLGAKSGW
jgi:hypothetical protein